MKLYLFFLFGWPLVIGLAIFFRKKLRYGTILISLLALGMPFIAIVFFYPGHIDSRENRARYERFEKEEQEQRE
jgi:hypothetical protein